MIRLTSKAFVRAGDLLRAGPWNEVARVIRSLRLISGIGVLLRDTPDGTFINFRTQNTIFDNPFRVTLNGEAGAQIKWGQINGVEGTINDLPLLPEEGQPARFLEFTGGVKLDKNGRGWIAAEVTCEKAPTESKNWAIKSWEIVQVADLNTDSGEVTSKDGVASNSAVGGAPNLKGRRARQPLAMLVRQASGNLVAYQVTFFHLAHRVKAPADPKADGGRHFFYPRG